MIFVIWELAVKNLALNLLRWCQPHSKHSRTYKLPMTGHTLPLWQELLLVLLTFDILTFLHSHYWELVEVTFIIFNVEYPICSVWESCLVCCHCVLWIQTFLSSSSPWDPALGSVFYIKCNFLQLLMMIYCISSQLHSSYSTVTCP